MADLVIVSFPRKYAPVNWLRWFWLTLLKRISLSYYTWGEIEAFARSHGLSVRQRIDISGYFVVSFTQTNNATR